MPWDRAAIVINDRFRGWFKIIIKDVIPRFRGVVPSTLKSSSTRTEQFQHNSVRKFTAARIGSDVSHNRTEASQERIAERAVVSLRSAKEM
jgi:hypothetical protein